MHKTATISIVGAGASGCFCAAQLHEALPGTDIRIFEAGKRPLAKLALTGGGRCNITNTFEDVVSLKDAYPRGANLMKRALAEFPYTATLDWFSGRGVRFVEEDGGRIFPASQNAMQIVDTLLDALDGVDIVCNKRIDSIPQTGIVVVSTGGGAGMDILRNLPVETEPPVPSLFAFNISDTPSGDRSSISSLMGLSCEVSLSLPGSNFRSSGPLLITDWGFSGPAALKLSSYAARHLAECNYRSPVSVRWLDAPAEVLRLLRTNNPRKQLGSVHPERIPSRLWEYLLARFGVDFQQPWAECSNRILNILEQNLLCDTYFITSKCPFRDEFVSCGGVKLNSVNLKDLECKQRPGLYFTGEVLDIDAVTGGFNLQAAWSTAHLVAKSIIKQYGTQNI